MTPGLVLALLPALATGPQDGLLRETEALLAALGAFRAERADDLRALAAARATGELPKWQELSPLRGSVRDELERLAGPWRAELARTDPEADGTAALCLSVLEPWLALGEPEDLLAAMRRDAALARTLGRTADEDARRRFLDRVATRAAGTPGTSDVDALAHVVAWEALFLARAQPGAEQLDALTTDLVLLFTDRAPDGVTRSKAGFYAPRRFLDRGFAEPLRDESDQVRHLCWALRVLAATTDRDKAVAFLRAKELADSGRRREPVNRADLELNRIARELVETILGDGEPLAIEALPPLLRERLSEH